MNSSSTWLRAQRAYGVAWLYLGCFVIAESVFAALSPHDRAVVTAWASTNVGRLRHDPIGTLVVSAFVPTSLIAPWPLAIALALFGANQVLGNWRTALLCTTGQVLGTLVSEGIVDYRVTHHLLPASYAHIVDVGPSYVVVSALAVAALYGSRAARVAAVADLAALIFGSRIFSGLTHLDVAAVGHATALAVSLTLGTLLVRRSRPRRTPPATATPGRRSGQTLEPNDNVVPPQPGRVAGRNRCWKTPAMAHSRGFPASPLAVGT